MTDRSQLATQMMNRALRLARRGAGYVEPNPLVGCVLADRDRVLGEGCHRRFGEAHAEINALSDCRGQGNTPKGADVYINLEPCSHHGKTPPCADALIDAGVRRVFIAMPDPFEKVAGRGIRRLKRAGVRVQVGLLEDEAAALNAPFVKRVTRKLPYVIAKWAQTLDGCIATATGDSRWISNEQSRKAVHQLRARVDAVVVGIGTALKDDPLLTARNVKRRRTATRVVVDPRLRLKRSCRLITSLEQDGVPLLIATSRESLGTRKHAQLQALGVTFIDLPERKDGRLKLTPLMRHLLAEYDATNVLVEGGAALLGAMFDQKLIDEVQTFVTPKLLGDAKGLSAVSGRGVKLMSKARTLRLLERRAIGDDTLLRFAV